MMTKQKRTRRPKFGEDRVAGGAEKSIYSGVRLYPFKEPFDID